MAADPGGNATDRRLDAVRIVGLSHDVAAEREAERRLTAELAAAKQLQAQAEEAFSEESRNTQILHDLGARLVTAENTQTIYDEILLAAIAITRAKAGTVQLLDGDRQELVILATRGFSRQTQEHFQRLDARSHTSCGLALRTGNRTYLNFDPASTDVADRLHVEDGVLSAQSSPLVSRSGKAIGMVSTHWGEADHRLSERELRFLDLLARQAADLIEQRTADAALRESEERQVFLLKLSDDFRRDADETAIGLKCVEALARHMGVDRCYITEMSEELNRRLVGPEFRTAGLPPISGVHPYDDYADALRRFRSGAPFVSTDVVKDLSLSALDKASIGDRLGLGAIISTFLYRGEGRTMWALTVGTVRPRAWTSDDRHLVQDVGERTWAAIERSRAEAALRESEERLRRLNERLEQRVVERTAEVRALFTRLVSAQEEERRRIARDIHDQVGQQMTALRMNLDALRSQTGGHATLLEQTERTQRLAEELDQSIDFLTWQLRPAALEHLGLSAALQNLVTSWSERFAVPADFAVQGAEDMRLPRDVEANLYRIAQEALHNIAKHAEATRATVVLIQHGRQLALVIEDNGRGFDPASSAAGNASAGLGLVSMRERAVLVGGQLDIDSSPEHGTAIYVRIPRL